MNPRRFLLPNHPRPGSEPTSRLRGSDEETPWRWRAFLAIGTAMILSLAGCAHQEAQKTPSLEGKPLSGYVSMSQVQAAYIGSGAAGHGTLRFRGQTYPFKVGGLGIGGIGVSTIKARGEVYGLRNLHDFPGAYGQVRYGFALGSTSAGDLWLQNPNGVILHLIARRQGLMLTLGGDAVVISMNQ
jgi:hypothetical protein